MFADNDRISLRQLKRQMVLSFLGPLLLFLAGKTAAGGAGALLGLLLGTLLLLLWVFLLVKTGEVWAAPERYLGAGGKWAAAAVYLSYLAVSGSVMLEQVVRAVQRYLLRELPAPALGAAFLAAAFLGMGQGAQRRGRLAEVSYPWVLGIFLLLFLLAALHFRGISPEHLGRPLPGTVSRETIRIFSLGTAFGLLPFSLAKVRESQGCFRVLRRGIYLLLLVVLGAAAVLLGVYGKAGAGRLDYPILNLMTGTSLPGGILGRVDILWLAVLLFCLLFAMGSILSYGGRIAGEKRGSFQVRLILGAVIWLGSLLPWEGEKLSQFYGQVMRDIYAPMFLGMTLLALWAKRRVGNEKKEAKDGEEK